MTLRVQETPHDHIPEEFTIESLKAGGMTDQEIELLGSGDDPIVDLNPAPEGEEAKAGEGDPAAEVTVGSAPETEQKADPDPEPAPEAKSADPVPDPAPEAVADPAPIQVPDTTEHEAKVEEIDNKLVELLQKYDDGELTSEEFTTQQRTMVTEQAQAQAAINQAATIAQNSVEEQQAHFYSRLEAYKEDAAELWSEEHLAGWDKNLRAVTGNEGYADMTRDAQIKLAHKMYAAEYEARHGTPLNIGKKADPAPTPDPKGDDPDKLEVRKGEKPEAPQTLANFNSESTSELEDSTFAAVDRQIMKDPIAAENAFERMTPEQQDRFLNEV